MAIGRYYSLYFTSLVNGEINFSTGVPKLMLCTNLYVLNQDTHRYKSDVTNEVTAGANYVAGGFTLGTITTDYDPDTNKWSFDAPDITMSPVAPLSRYGVLYLSAAATDATRPLIGSIDFESDLTPAIIEWDGTGIAGVTVT